MLRSVTITSSSVSTARVRVGINSALVIVTVGTPFGKLTSLTTGTYLVVGIPTFITVGFPTRSRVFFLRCDAERSADVARQFPLIEATLHELETGDIEAERVAQLGELRPRRDTDAVNNEAEL